MRIIKDCAKLPINYSPKISQTRLWPRLAYFTMCHFFFFFLNKVSKHFTIITTPKQINTPTQPSCPMTLFLRPWKANLCFALKELLFSVCWICRVIGRVKNNIQETQLLYCPAHTACLALSPTPWKNGYYSKQKASPLLLFLDLLCKHRGDAFLLRHNLPAWQRSKA